MLLSIYVYILSNYLFICNYIVADYDFIFSHILLSLPLIYDNCVLVRPAGLYSSLKLHNTSHLFFVKYCFLKFLSIIEFKDEHK